jgi:IS5 family transposase
MAAEIAGQGRVTLGADKGYDQKELVRALREHRVTPHVAQKVNSAIDRRSTRHTGYRLSQWRRKRVEEIFGWLKTVAGLRKPDRSSAVGHSCFKAALPLPYSRRKLAQCLKPNGSPGLISNLID